MSVKKSVPSGGKLKKKAQEICYVKIETLLDFKSPGGEPINAHTLIERILRCFDPEWKRMSIYDIRKDSTIIEFYSIKTARLFSEFYEGVLCGISSLSVTRLDNFKTEEEDDDARKTLNL